MRRLLAALTLLAAGCATQLSQPATRFKILQINDVYKIEGLEGGQLGGLRLIPALAGHVVVQIVGRGGQPGQELVVLGQFLEACGAYAAQQPYGVAARGRPVFGVDGAEEFAGFRMP